MSKGKRSLVILVFVIILIFFHSTPTLALRTSVFYNGHPIVAITTEIQEFEQYNQQDKERHEKENTKLYKLAPPPIDKATKGSFYTWKVKQIFFLYFASYAGEGW